MPKRPKMPKSQQASIPTAEKLGGTIGMDKADLRDLVMPPLDFETRSMMPLVNKQLEAYAEGMSEVGRNMIFATGDPDALRPADDNRRFFAISTKNGGHLGFFIEDGSFIAGSASVEKQIMDMAAMHWGPGVELETVTLENSEGYAIRPKHHVVMTKDPEIQKIEDLLTSQREAYRREFRRYPSTAELYGELVRLGKWMDNDGSYAYLADWCETLGFMPGFDGTRTGRTIHQVMEDMSAHHGSVTGRWEGAKAVVRGNSPTGRLVEGPRCMYDMYPQRMLERIMTRDPFAFAEPTSSERGFREFRDRYVKDRTNFTRRGGKMSDYLNQMHSALAHFWFKQTPNHIDDVFNRAERKVQAMQEARLREYCWADVLITADYAKVEMRVFFTMLDGYPTVDVSHRLTGPYGWASGQGTGILIEYMSGSDDHPWPTRREADMISGIFVSFGCAPVYAQKAADSLFGCGQYSCIVTVSKLALRNLGYAMEAVGCALTITQHPGAYPEDSNKDIR